MIGALLSAVLCLGILPAMAAAQGAQAESAWGAASATQRELSTALYAAVDGQIELTPGHHPRWIDRVALPEPVKGLYDRLVEAADNDGVEDWLIDPEGFAQWMTGMNAERYLVVEAFTIPEYLDGGEIDYYQRCIWTVLGAFNRDHPEVFWLSNTSRLLYERESSATVFYLVLKKEDGYHIATEGYASPGVLLADIQRLDRAVEAILADRVVFGGETLSYRAWASDQDNLRYFNAWLILHNEYNLSGRDYPESAYSSLTALTGSSGIQGPVCEGYAKALKVLCDRVQIPCVLEDGQSYNSAGGPGTGHMWNLVGMEDGAWYGVDVTWNDPLGGALGAVSGKEEERFLLVGSETEMDGMRFSQSHEAENQVYVDGVRYLNGPELSRESYAQRLPRSVAVSPSEGGTVSPNPTLAAQGTTVTVTAAPAAGYALTNLTAVDGGGQRVELVSHPDGSYTFSMPDSAVTLYPVFTRDGEEHMPFADVGRPDWFYDAVNYVWREGLMQGTGMDTFGPWVITTRAQLVTILYRMEEEPALSGGIRDPYGDVDSASWYGPAVYWARECGVISGYSQEQFGPQDTITREQLAAILYRYAQYKGYNLAGGSSLMGFTDQGSVSGWSQQALEWAVGNELIQGSGGLIRPQDGADRAQVATVLMRFTENFAAATMRG